MDYLSSLNNRQKEAVTHKEGPLLVIAGAGAGKTRVITNRIIHLIEQGIPPENILAVTFTNKAAHEMQERVIRMSREHWSRTNSYEALPFIGTFHSLGARILRESGNSIGIKRQFVIKDKDDCKSLIRGIIRDMGLNLENYEPKKFLHIISKNKGDLTSINALRESIEGKNYFQSTLLSVWEQYENSLAKECALDFDDLLLKPVELLLQNKNAREYYQSRWHYIHIDEYQDTNRAQYMLAKILAEKHKNICVVGDLDQCLIQGMKISMGDGTIKPIEKVHIGEYVLSNYGSGDERPAQITNIFSRSFSGKMITITTNGGRSITTTPEHIHFAGYRAGLTQQLYFTYLMYKRGVGFRIGVSQMYARGQEQPMPGFIQRCNQEHGDAAWIIGVHSSPNEARVFEYTTSLAYQIPTLPFVARRGNSQNGYIHEQKMIDRIFNSFDTLHAGEKLLDDMGLSQKFPHHWPQSSNSNRRNIIVTLCGDRRGKTPMHRISIIGNDSIGKKHLVSLGLSVRPAKKGSRSWRFETCQKDYKKLLTIIEHIIKLFPDATVIRNARLGKNMKYLRGKNSLPFLPAASIKPGMALFIKNGEYDVVKKVEGMTVNDIKIYDLNIEKTHNFIANGIITHNSIYGWRGAHIGNLLRFEKDYLGTKTVFLEENYRSTEIILGAANEIIQKNKFRVPKNLFTQKKGGEKIGLSEAISGNDEAMSVVSTAQKYISQGTKPEDIALLYRANFQSRALEEACIAASVPYQIIGTRFFERKEIKDIISFIRAARNPESLGDIKRIINVPPRGIGKVTIAKLFSGQKNALPASTKIKIENFYALLKRIEQASNKKSPREIVAYVLEETGIKKELEKEKAEGEERLENIRELATIARRYDILAPENALEKFLEDAALATDQDTLIKEGRGIRLMTIHASKGLEFPYVFIVGMEEGLFPHNAFDANRGLEEHMEEERRLFYVALTRAQKKVHLSYAQTRIIFGHTQVNIPSQFIHDIPKNFLEIENLRSENEIQEDIEYD